MKEELEKKFHSAHYLRHNRKRLEHLESLGIPLRGKSVLEVGAGIGDLSEFLIREGAQVTITEVREENLEYVRNRFPGQRTERLDLEAPAEASFEKHDMVFCYGTLYHLRDPAGALKYLAGLCKERMLVETCVSFGKDEAVNRVREDRARVSQSFEGIGCRPTRIWIYRRLQELFPFVYVPRTQPDHEEFPVDWTRPEKHKAKLSRAIFVASRQKIQNENLQNELPDRQIRFSADPEPNP
ncbi:MAG: class I SAM-dependent methyltransferase [Candidatus Omnitrophota bacterium]